MPRSRINTTASDELMSTVIVGSASNDERNLEPSVQLKVMLISFVAAAALEALASGTHAMPRSVRVGTDGVAVEFVAYRKCWMRDGKRVCRWVERRRTIVERRGNLPILPPNLGWGWGFGM